MDTLVMSLFKIMRMALERGWLICTGCHCVIENSRGPLVEYLQIFSLSIYRYSHWSHSEVFTYIFRPHISSVLLQAYQGEPLVNRAHFFPFLIKTSWGLRCGMREGWWLAGVSKLGKYNVFVTSGSCVCMFACVCMCVCIHSLMVGGYQAHLILWLGGSDNSKWNRDISGSAVLLSCG